MAAEAAPPSLGNDSIVGLTTEAPRCVYHAALTADFFDPIRNELACALCYATGAAHGHPCLSIAQALEEAEPRILRQVEANDARLAQLQTLKTSLGEMTSVSVLREKDAEAQVRQHVAATISALQKREAALIADVAAAASAFRERVATTEAQVTKAISGLLGGTNTLTAHIEGKEAAVVPADGKKADADSADAAKKEGGSRAATPGASGASPIAGHEQRLAARVLQALVHTERELDDTRYFPMPDTPLYSVRGVTTAVHGPAAAAADVVAVGVSHKASVVAPLVLTGPGAMATAVASAALSSQSTYDVPVPWRPAESSSQPCPRGALFLLGCTANRRRVAGRIGSAYAAATAAAYSNPFTSDEEAGSLLRVFCNVPVADGAVAELGQEALFNDDDELLGPMALKGVRTCSALGAAVWWDFGEGNGIDVSGYTLVHGHASEHCALRGWRLLGTNTAPPTVAGHALRSNPETASHSLMLTPTAAEVGAAAAVDVLDERSNVISFGAHAFGSSHFECQAKETETAAAPRFYRFVAVQVTRPDAAGEGMFHVELAGAEFFGNLHFGGAAA